MRALMPLAPTIAALLETDRSPSASTTAVQAEKSPVSNPSAKITPFDTGVAVGGTDVAVGGTGVLVGGTVVVAAVAVGGTAVAVGGTVVVVGGTAVAVGGRGVSSLLLVE